MTGLLLCTSAAGLEVPSCFAVLEEVERASSEFAGVLSLIPLKESSRVGSTVGFLYCRLSSMMTAMMKM